MAKADAQLQSTQDVDETELTAVLGEADGAMDAGVGQHVATLGEQADGMSVHRDTLRAALAERDEQLAQLKVQLGQALLESEAESEKSRSRLMALLTAGQEVVGKLGTAVLSAHDASAKPRPLEEIITPVATGAPRARPRLVLGVLQVALWLRLQ